MVERIGEVPFEHGAGSAIGTGLMRPTKMASTTESTGGQVAQPRQVEAPRSRDDACLPVDDNIRAAHIR